MITPVFKSKSAIDENPLSQRRRFDVRRPENDSSKSLVNDTEPLCEHPHTELLTRISPRRPPNSAYTDPISLDPVAARQSRCVDNVTLLIKASYPFVK